jgi:isopenicillin N synthase-like dioxygenase
MPAGKNAKRTIFFYPAQIQVRVNPIPQHKAKNAKPDRRASRNNLECIATGDNFLKRTPIVQTLRLTINK